MSEAFRFTRDLAWNVARKFQQDNCPQLSASITYYVIFSLFPLLIFLAGVVGLFLSASAQADIVTEVLKQIPLNETEGRQNVVEAVHAITGSRAPLLGVIGLLGMAWGGSGMFTAVRRALNIIYDEPGYTRPWFWQKAVDLSLVLGIGVFIGASIAASAALRVTQARSEDLHAVGRLSDDLGFVWTLAEYLVPFVFSLVAFTVLYTLVPSRNRNLGNAWPGALLAALLFEAVKFGFSFYVTSFRRFDLVFGSLGAVAAFMFWVFVCTQIMLLGAEVAAVYPEARRGKFRQPALEGMGVPLHTKLRKAVRRLFVRD
ncbi:MAG TPA: YihY/virulence factor BrkB family protein [Dehalococcoidia bacterium]|nr:YihY/virulence factor BrkB family protein [Dehalococcoidia bacterium]